MFSYYYTLLVLKNRFSNKDKRVSVMRGIYWDRNRNDKKNKSHHRQRRFRTLRIKRMKDTPHLASSPETIVNPLASCRPFKRIVIPHSSTNTSMTHPNTNNNINNCHNSVHVISGNLSQSRSPSDASLEYISDEKSSCFEDLSVTNLQGMSASYTSLPTVWVSPNSLISPFVLICIHL